MIAAALTVIFALLPLEGIWKLLAFLIPYLTAGYDVLRSAVRNIFHGQVFDEKFLMAIATLGALALGEYPEAAGVMIFYQTGELFQSIAVGRSRKSVAALMDIRPDTAAVLRGGHEISVNPEEVEVGETIVIRPGEKIPLDGTLIEGHTTINAAALTGESIPSDIAEGDRVISGSVNLTGLIKVRTESSFGESTVSKILELVENASDKKARVESFISRFARWYTPCVVIGAVLLAFIPPIFIGGWREWINRALIFLMVSCPCALVVSVPMSFFGGIGGASRQGILIKGSNYMEALSKIDTVVFDKTGTLTRGCFAVDAVHPSNVSEDELLDIAAAAESYSSHPVGESIVAAHGGHLDKSRIADVEELAGMGLRAVVDGRNYYVGNGKLMDRVGAGWHECHLVGTVIHVSRDSEYLGHIVINDEIKPDSEETVKRLKAMGIKKTVMLTGDRRKVAEHVGEKLGIDEVYSELLPAQKVEKVEELISSGARLAFAGDGINDAPVIMRADVGIAMGAMGSDAAIESADIVLMDDRPSRLPLALEISRRTMRIVRENIIFALGVKAVILILGALGLADMWAAIFGDVGVMVLAVINSMRAMLKVK